MKIGIITFHCVHNYGAMLQAYGLQEYLKHLGHETYIIDYRPKYKTDSYKKFNPRYWLSRNPYKCIVRLLTEIIVKPIRIRRWYAFEGFMKKYFSLYKYNSGEDFSSFDYLVIGSDQVWNPSLTGGKFQKIYFGEGANCSVISYAASSKFSCLNVNQQNYFSKQLKHFSAIGVRESSLEKILQPLTDKPVVTVVDPTLLAGKKIFDNLIVLPKINNYLLFYQIGNNQSNIQYARKIAADKKMKFLYVTSHPILPHSNFIQTATPNQFLGLIANADFVVTTSFHGLALSILYNRQFIALESSNNGSLRLSSLLNKLGLSDYLVNINSEFHKDSIDYAQINFRLEKEVSYSRDFLKQNLVL